ncbi:hypothetical protein E1A91_D10G119600v1 [Gossypium mustelinum]|nr:hypothetical protein ES319_D10G114800v1 [Gossypium barbadense]KAB2008671.1 hypothetical protein ES319_D10G114800v1 [Gossypium barbadense]TYG49789.1 hypothetical protein ES288_D10G122500v1 [Gossypium darwinii]TYG49790.1 hypothetical protein ES288_D10G122500v1 [Gossypium darwinii]TYI60663.1 hypothetical protein E1A91_D10G119600v1 [Gossypium mustelinum]
MKQVNIKPSLDVRLSDLKLVLGPELRIVYPLILNFTVSGELELNGQAHPKWIKPKGILTFENGDVNLVATQASIVRQLKDPEMAMQWTLIYQLTSWLRVLLQSAPSKRLLFEYSATSQD